MKRNQEIPVEDQIKFWLLFADYTNSASSGAISYGAMHGGGSPIMEQIAIYTQYNIDACKNIVRRIAGMPLLEKKKKK